MTVKKHINEIRVGDVVRHNGIDCTVGNADLKSCSFMGRSLFGDSYHSGHKLVEVVKVAIK